MHMSSFFQPTYIIAVLIALSVHEWAHAFTAWKLGDSTAKYQGRLTVNPVAHIDPIGALLFLVAGFGWAKPVPVNPYAFKHMARDTSLTALAGPFSNLILAFVSFLLLSVTGVHADGVYGLLAVQAGGSPVMTIVTQILAASLYVNLALMAFNLFPLAPLDGSKILYVLLPDAWHEGYDRFMQYGQWILLFLVFGESLLPFPLLSTWIGTIMQTVLTGFSIVTGQA
jgi:Zn-dependent protease